MVVVIIAGQAESEEEDDDKMGEWSSEGWDVVSRPTLPPPPSQPDEVEHWARAMFQDNNSNSGSVASGSSAGGRGAAAGASRMCRMHWINVHLFSPLVCGPVIGSVPLYKQ